ncbi:MAG: CDP-diacylglycerol--glycerol-3-phosphate 3-phosphatidyltransferase [Pseudomonadota bacterium]
MELNSANILTLARIVMIPILVGVFYLEVSWANWASAIIFSLAAITDWLDGYVARRFNQTSRFGAFLDPVADKLMVGVTLVLLTQQHPTAWFAIPAAIIIGREITISALREWMAEIGESKTVKVHAIGKVKTTFQMIALILLLINEPVFGLPIFALGHGSLWFAAVLTIWSMVIYLRAAWPAITHPMQKPPEP